MSPIMTGVVGMLVMLVLLFCGMPVGFGMAIIGFFGFMYLCSFNATVAMAGFTPFAVMANYGFAVLPLFLLMANVCFHSGLGGALFELVYKWMGRLPAGLAISTIAAMALFGAASASATATSLTIGLVAMPEMKKHNYSRALTTGCVAVGGVLGVYIPPSGLLIIYGMLSEQSIGELFIAGIMPGIISAIFMMITIIIWQTVNPAAAPAGPSSSMKEKLVALGGSIEMLCLIVLIIGGIIIGWFTPTEAGAMGAFGAILFSLVRRRLSWQGFRQSITDTVLNSGMLYLLMIGAFIFNAFFALTTIPQEFAGIVTGLGLPKYAIMAMMIFIYLVLGCFIDILPMILLTIPVFYPLCVALGFHPVWFGIIIVLVAGMASVTPPVGLAVYVIAGVAKEPIGTVFRGIIPFLAGKVVLAGILIAFPQIVLFLPGLMR